MNIIKKNITLILGMSIPVLMILFVIGSIYIPRLFIKPQFNFLYSQGGSNYYGQQQYSVQNGKLIKNENKQPSGVNYNIPKKPQLYIYNITKNSSQAVSFTQAQDLNLDSNITSSDGFKIVPGNNGIGLMPFFGWSQRDYNVRYITGHNASVKLNIPSKSTAQYINDFSFIGWIK